MSKKRWCIPVLLLAGVFLAVPDTASGKFYLGLQGGWSAQKPSFTGVAFNTDTTFLYGAQAGLKFLMLAVEVNYFQAAHNLEVKDLLSFDWGGKEVDYNYLGLNVKMFFPLLLVHPYLTAGYGYYTADIRDIDKDTDRGFNVGAGLELRLGSTLALQAEGKYHRVKVSIEERELTLGDFTLSGGVNIYF